MKERSMSQLPITVRHLLLAVASLSILGVGLALLLAGAGAVQAGPPDQGQNPEATIVTSSSPTRIFNIEWRAGFFGRQGSTNFEVQLYEGQTTLDFIYGQVDDGGASATIGLQKDGGEFTQCSCNTTGVTNGLEILF